MPLYDRLRQNNKVFFKEFFVNTLVKNDQQRASRLLRTVALYALTYTEHQFSAKGTSASRPRELDAITAYDAWFPCGITGNDGTIENKKTFASRYTSPEDRIIKANEVSPDYNPTEDPIENKYYVPNVPVEINADNNAATDINKISFFDEVNSTHNWHTSRARLVNNNGTLPQFINVASNEQRSIYMTVQKTGNCEGTVVQNWGAYINNNNIDQEETKKFREKIDFNTQVATFKKLKNHFKNRTTMDSLRVANLRDLYRLECIREPAALLTNAMFLDLATASNYGYDVLNITIDFDNITKVMPMAPKKTVEQCRILWSDLIGLSNDKNIPIYYRYDYSTVTKTYSYNFSFSTLVKLENNLLFCYLIYKADQLNNNTDIKEIIDNIYLNNEYEDKELYDNSEFPVAFLVNSLNYPIEIYIGSKDNGDRTISIASFPLMLLKILLYEWYYVDLDLPDIQIEGIYLSPQ